MHYESVQEAAAYVRGKLLFDGKDYVGQSGDGKFIKQKKLKFKGPEL